MYERIYVCHTYYHVYIACLKELMRRKACGEGRAEIAEASLVLSTMSNDFKELPERARRCGLFAEVFLFEEKEDTFFPELKPLRTDTGNLARNMVNRMVFLRRFAALEAPFVPVDFRAYRDIYVFCDSDPIGYYLSANRIRYHALEDGLDCLKYYDTARYDNRGHFEFKAWMARMGLIFIQNGYGKYCIDMEVNDIDALQFPGPGAHTDRAARRKERDGRRGKCVGKEGAEASRDTGKGAEGSEMHRVGKYVESSREAMVSRLTQEDKNLLTELFIANLAELQTTLATGGLLECGARGAGEPAEARGTEELTADGQDTGESAVGVRRKPVVLVLSEPLCDLETRKRLFMDLIRENGTVDGREAQVVIKPHPRDVLDYRKEFSDYLILDPFFPMEILNFVEGLWFDKVVTVYTVPSSIHCAGEKVYLGDDFMDRYEAPEIHRQNEQI
ncbi:MAG: lipooligosaccharide sialyltransferase [Eubacteriales bacterium]|nr:lipooligosaccharide sialyltransferase [Eubacteriales bacterium]